MKKLIRYVLLFALLPSLMLADQVTLQNGTKYDGKIISADQNYIYLQISDSATAKIPHTLVKSVFLTYSDLVYLLTGEIIECKIIDEVLPDLLIVTEQGPAAIRVVELKKYYYNDADSLLIPVLPPTGKYFNNQKIFERQKRILGKYLLLGMHAGAVNLPATEWNNNFITASKLLGFSSGINIGYSFHSHLLSNLGIEYNWYPNNFEKLISTVKRYYLYLGIAYLHNFSFLPDFDFSLGTDIGLNFLRGNIYLFSYRNTDLKDGGIQPAVRPYLAIQKSIANRLITRFQLGYLLGRPFTVKPEPDYLKKVTIGYNGPFFMFNFYYQFPL